MTASDDAVGALPYLRCGPTRLGGRSDEKERRL
jgi:hypothetical protein